MLFKNEPHGSSRSVLTVPWRFRPEATIKRKMKFRTAYDPQNVRLCGRSYGVSKVASQRKKNAEDSTMNKRSCCLNRTLPEEKNQIPPSTSKVGTDKRVKPMPNSTQNAILMISLLLRLRSLSCTTLAHSPARRSSPQVSGTLAARAFTAPLRIRSPHVLTSIKEFRLLD